MSAETEAIKAIRSIVADAKRFEPLLELLGESQELVKLRAMREAEAASLETANAAAREQLATFQAELATLASTIKEAFTEKAAEVDKANAAAAQRLAEADEALANAKATAASIINEAQAVAASERKQAAEDLKEQRALVAAAARDRAAEESRVKALRVELEQGRASLAEFQRKLAQAAA